MKVGHIELFVRDPMASKRFYEEVLGFTVDQVQGEMFVWLESGNATFLLRPGPATPGDGSVYSEEAAAGIVLYTDDLDAARRRLEDRGLAFRGTDGSDACLTFQDPDGHWFQLVNPTEH